MSAPLPFRSKLAVLGLVMALATGRAAAENGGSPEMGGRYRHTVPQGSDYLPVGCWDHRALMFIVREMGTDAGAARQLAEWDCRPLVPEGVYLKCGPGGLTFPVDGSQLPYSGYCRAGASDIQLYVLDAMMAPVPPATP